MKKTQLIALFLTLLAGSLAFAGSAYAQSATTAQNGQMPYQGRAMMKNPGVFGTVTAVSGTTITLTDKRTNTSYTIDASNAKIEKNKVQISVSGIAVGDTLIVQGTVNGNSVTATTIKDGQVQMGNGVERKPGVSGTVTAINGTTLTVASKGFGQKATATTYTVDASSATVQKNGVSSSVSDIAINDTVMVAGTVNGTSVKATTIRDGRPVNMIPEGNGQPVIGGTVSSVSGSIVTISNKSNVAYTVDVSNAKITKDGKSASITDIVTGDTLLVQGTVNGTSVVATTVTDHAKPANTNSSVSGNASQGNPGFFGRIGGFFAHLFGF